ncbi:hypothetical protein J6E39_07490 [bacterium]|nr:hypothetical protein [bacterium]
MTIKIFRKFFNTISNLTQCKSKVNRTVTKLENKPDEFISTAERIKRNHDSEMMGIETAEIKKVKFFDEDIEKMKKMEEMEAIAYRSKLKREGRYTYEE